MSKKKKSPTRGFYDRPIHERLAVRVVDGLLSAGIVYLLSPYLMEVLTPVQAQINASATASGATVSNVGTSKSANVLLAAAAS